VGGFGVWLQDGFEQRVPQFVTKEPAEERRSYETTVDLSSGYGGLDEYDTPMGHGRILLEGLKAQER